MISAVRKIEELCFSLKDIYRAFCSVLFIIFLIFAHAYLAAAAEKFCSDYPNGVIDGLVDPVPTQITIDRDCTFQNWTQWNPLTATINFQTNDPTQYLIIFDQTTFTGHMACANVDHKIWFSNGSDYGSGNACQDLFIPVETIHKQNPAGQSTAAVGVPFTYTLTLPSMNWPIGDPSNNDLHSIVLTDDLTATGVSTTVDLTYLSNTAYLVNGGMTTSLGALTLSAGSDNKHLEFNFNDNPEFALLPAGSQIVVEITVVLDDSAANTAGKQFVNTAKWSFGRAIDVDDDGVITYPDEFFEPLPGEWGISQPMSIGEPDLVVTKTSSETALNLGVPATFTIDVQNRGGGDAWNATILDRLPDIPGQTGMCPATMPAVNAEIFEADGVTSVSGGALTAGGDYTVSYNAGACELSLTLSDTSKAKIGPSQRLIITYDAELDADTDPAAEGIPLTNVAGATYWYSGDSSQTDRRSYGGGPASITDGTPGVSDFQDSATVTTALSGYYFQKTVEDLTSGANPATTAAPGDRLRYRLRLFNVDQTIDAIIINDPLDPDRFDLNTFALTTLPAGADYNFNSVTGQLEISGNGSPLSVAIGGELVIEFEITLDSSLGNGTEVANQATLSANTGSLNAESDDPYLNGIAAPGEDADPTVIQIQSPGPLGKATTQASATIGEQFIYRITVPATPVSVPLYDVRILDDLNLSAADMRFISATLVSDGNRSLGNTGTDTDLVIEDTATGIDIPANGQAVIDITVELLNTDANIENERFNNSARYTYNRSNGVDTTQTSGGASSSTNMTVVEPDLTATKVAGFVSPAGKLPTDSATVGDVLEYTITVSNGGNSTAFDTNVADTLPVNLSLVAGSATAQINNIAVAGFVANPTTLSGGALAWGRRNGDGTLDIPAGQSLVLTYQATVASVTGADVANSAYVDWTSLDGASAAERTGADCPIVDILNDYCYGPAAVSVATVDNTAIAKTVVGDSYAETPVSTTDPIVRVGDTVTYDLTLNLQEYTTHSVVVEDTLPVGMVLESFTINGSAGFSYTLTAQPAPGATGTMIWNFGDITNPPSGDGTPIDTLVIEYVAEVVTDAAPQGVAEAPTILRDNLAKLSYTGGDPAVYPDRLTATETIDVRQPQMSAISKVDLGTGRLGTGTMADPYQVNIGTDEMQFRLSSCNTGLAPAYGVILTDLLAPELDEGDLTATPPVVKIGTTTLNAGTDYTFSAPPMRGGEMRIALRDGAPVNPGECVTVDYTIGFYTDLTISTSWSNQARLPEYRSLPLAGPGRLYTSTDLAEVWMTNLVNDEQLLKTLASSSDATIGEEVVYRIAVPAAPMNTALNDVVVTDSLNSTLTYVGASAVDSGGAPVSLTDTSVAPGQVTLSIANIPAGQQVIITLMARVVNNAQANAGVSFANTAAYTYTDMPAGLDTSSTSGPLTIVEPAVTITKSVANLSRPGAAPRAGEILRYSLSFTAGGGAAGDAFSDAFDLLIEDSLSLGMVYQNGTAGVDGPGNTITDPTVTGDGSTTAQTLTWSLADATADIDVVEGSVVTVTYDVRVLDDVPPGQEMTNSVTAQWTGLDGVSALERTGSGSPVENDYFTGPVTLTVTSEFAISFEKSVVNATTGEDPGANARPGDTLRYTLVLTNQSIAALDNPIVVDALAAQFAPGSLQLIEVSDTGADTTHTDATGGANGTGILDIRNLTLAAQGDANDTVTIVFEARLAPVIQSGTTVLNQAQLTGDNQTSVTSNETATLITSAPVFEIQKTSQDITGDPAELRAGEILRYTITINNVGDEDAVNVRLQDDTPANCTYVADSTTLNDAAVPDPGPGVNPLHAGIPVNAPGDTTAGVLHADAAGGAANVATVTFDVMVDPNAMEGLIIENQGFLNGSGAGSGPQPEQPSDDPSTPIPDDPTLDIVGKLPLLYAHKTVAIDEDFGSPGIVDPGDVLRYTISVSNLGNIPATNVTLSDSVPANTTYVADSMRLNGAAVGPDGGVSPLIAGLPLHSADNPGPGIVSAGNNAVVTFRVRVNDGVPTGTIISNQGSVTSAELPTESTDADGLPSNGDQPTVIVVGDVQLLAVTKEVGVAGGGSAEAGGQLVYTIRVTNIGSLPATRVVVTDDLAPPLGDQVVYINGSGTLDGSTAGVTYAGTMLTADYAAQYGDLQPGNSAVVRFRVRIASSLAIGTTITNTAVVRWNDPVQTASAGVSLDVGGTPGSASLNGEVWHDANLDKRCDDSTETRLEGWSVELYRGDQRVTTVLTDADGAYRLSGLVPNAGTADSYELRFRAGGATANTPSLGMADSPFTNGPQRISAIAVASGGNLQNLNLPLWPNGTVYNAVVREPVAGASLALLNASTGEALPVGCFDDPVQQNQVTAQDGFYKFDLNFSNAACPAGGEYLIEVTPPTSGYEDGTSQIIPPAGDTSTAPFSIPDCPGSADDALPDTAEYCEVVDSAAVPPLSVLPRTAGTTYYLHLLLSDGTVPGQSQIFNNPIPVDPVLDGAVAITKTSSMLNVTRAALVPYTITVTNVYGVPLYDIGIVDLIPAGFKYVSGSARLDGSPAEPHVNGRELLWDGIDLQVNARHAIRLLLVVGSGVSEGEYVNRAQVHNTASGAAVSGMATATVRVIPDPTFDCTDVIGKVFDDFNLNGRQDEGEDGLPGVRVVTARGLIASTDAFGRFHITCAAVPDEDFGSNLILKLDERSLPTGYRMTTENPRVQRATRGKMLRFNFGATIHRVVRLDIADGVFEPDTSEMRLQWRPRIARLIEELQKAPSVLRLSYLADVEHEGLVQDRLDALEKEITRQWEQSDGGYRLVVENEVFWRRGASFADRW